jgi:hypothetical protein
LQLRLNIAGGHATSIQGQDFVIEALQSRLTLSHELRLEDPLSIARHLDLHMSLLAFERFLTRSIARIPQG